MSVGEQFIFSFLPLDIPKIIPISGKAVINKNSKSLLRALLKGRTCWKINSMKTRPARHVLVFRPNAITKFGVLSEV